MTAIIKSSASAVRPVRSFGRPSEIVPAEDLSVERALKAQIAQLEAEIVRRDEAAPELLAKARAAGAREALAERSDAEANALKALKRALEDARAGWSSQIEAWESQSIGIARAVLEQVFCDAADRASQIVSAIQHRLGLLDVHSVVRLRVSPDDFPDPGQLERTARQIGTQVELISDPKLQSGECVFDLKLGHIEIGPRAQWARIAELLDRLEREATER